jgi:hypothetical protein
MTAIRWTDDSTDSPLGWALSRLASLLPAGRGRQVAAAGAAPQFYSTIFRAPLKRRGDFRKAAELALPQLMPLRLEHLQVYGRRTKDGVELVAFRNEDLAAWRATSKHSAAIAVSSTWSVLTPESQRITASRWSELSKVC